MAVTKYQYDITDTVDDAVNVGLLTNQIDSNGAIGVLVDPAGGMSVGVEPGKLDIYMSDALTAPQEAALTATVAAHQATVTFRQFRFWEENPSQSTALEAYQTAISRVSTPTGEGVYLVSWYAEVRVVPGAAPSGGQVQFRVDGNAVGNAYYAGEEWSAISGWDRNSMQEGETPTLDLRYRRAPALGGDGTIEIRKIKMSMEYMG
jgi:hypothetical protein